ncbi:MAG TPA: glycosyltransferase [Nanoarchaeota archaeon]|nr:glycosyltransferase [Nanoarchaeota archaeon]HIH58528.1 glycosyltransferase [Nanoarchaeota archaeon]HII14658.1 glycosyltransferase [Nanoarchaeota archaeon]HIJ04853.1 glycosyltransferase [Nanoarchaeota archaeon]
MKVTVIIPAYNEEKYIERTLQAISDAEIVVVCNGCTDKTEDIARKYADTVIVLKEKGVSRARNAGAKEACSERLVFMDADILPEKDLFEKIGESRYTVGTCKVKADSSYLFDRVMMFIKSNIHYLGYCTGLIFCDKDLFEQAGRFEESLSKKEDGRLLRRARTLGNFGIVDAYIYNNMRRYRKKGYIRICLFWIKEYLFPSTKEYESIR